MGITQDSRRALLFWLGAAALVVGVALQLPDFFGAAAMHYQLKGMAMSPMMWAGMFLIVVGILLAGAGLIPAGAGGGVGTRAPRFAATESGTLTAAHRGLLLVMGVALVVDVMKPATLGFVIPGMKAEYNISSSRVAFLPFVALTGTVVGSLLWGYLADRMGRRAPILLAALMFIGTSVCATMPSFSWNLAMCFLMGLSAGGMLPIVYALMAESIPASKRGWLVVLLGGLGAGAGYLAASGLATLLEPTYGWRIMWLLNLPTGALLIVLNHWIPESPRFLFSRGREAEASRVMARYGMTLVDEPEGGAEGEVKPGTLALSNAGNLFRPPYLPQTLVMVFYGLSWGLVNFGFITFLPTILGDLGYKAQTSRSILFLSAVISLPASFVAAWLYQNWSSKRSMILYGALTAITLVGFAFLHPRPTDDGVLLTALIVLLLASSGGVIAMLAPYTTEVYPTRFRGTGSGLVAASGKAAGMLAPPIFAVLLASSVGLAAPALVVAVPMAATVLILGAVGRETSGKPLEDLSEVTRAA